MKKWLLFFGLFLLGSINLAGQGYRPMAVDSAIWQMKFFYDPYEPTFFNYIYHFCLGDTVIGDHEYKQIFVDQLSSGPGALIREDTLEKKVYAIVYSNYLLIGWDEAGICPLDEEFVLFDFSGNVGDTVFMCSENYFAYPNNGFIINEIEPAEFLGYSTKKYTGYWEGSDSISDSFSYYEGIGWEYFGVFGTYWFGPTLSSYCIGYSEETCFGTISTKEVSRNAFIIYPNPTSDKIQLTWEKTLPKYTRVILSDVNGNTLQVITIQDNQQSVEINMEDLSSGLYFYRIVSAGRVLGSGKVVKE